MSEPEIKVISSAYYEYAEKPVEDREKAFIKIQKRNKDAAERMFNELYGKDDLNVQNIATGSAIYYEIPNKYVIGK